MSHTVTETLSNPILGANSSKDQNSNLYNYGAYVYLQPKKNLQNIKHDITVLMVYYKEKKICYSNTNQLSNIC